MQQQLTRVRGAWSGLPARAQYAMIGVAAITVLVMFLVLRAATSTEWTAATASLPADKLGQAETVLDEAGIKHRVVNDMVEVPVADHPKAAAALIPAGIAAKGNRASCADASEKGSSLIAQTSAQSALMRETCSENQVANAIEQIDGIEKATVDATLTEKALFSSEEEPAKATVLLDTGGNGLPKGVVKGIQQSVAAAFPGLKPANVTITDETGNLLGGSDEDEAAASMKKLESEARYNAKIEADLGSKIEAIVGKGNYTLSSNVELDMDKIRRDVLEHSAAGDNGDQLVEAENIDSEALAGEGDTGVQGVAGSATNEGVDPQDRRTVTDDATTTTDGDAYVKKVSGTQYANNKVAEAIDVAPGAVLRFRLGAVVDDDVDPAAASAVKNLLLAWMGGNAEDSLSFDLAPLATASGAATGTEKTSTVGAIAGYLKWALLGLGLIGLAFVLRRTLTQRTAELLAPADDLLLLETGDFTPIPIAELEAALAANQPSADRRARMEMQRKVERLADNKPEDVANELRRWMNHDDHGGFAPTVKQRKVG